MSKPEGLRRLARGRLTKAMCQVESLPATSAGALLACERETPAGIISVERHRVCWIVSTRSGRRLRDILREHSSLAVDDNQLDAFYARCQLQRRPFGEMLVAEGLVSPGHLRAAMKRHIVESLLALDVAISDARPDLSLSWTEHTARGYNPRYTFTGTEVLAALGAHLIDETTAELVAEHLDALASSGCASVAFSPLSNESPLFTGAIAAPWLRVEDLLDLTEWAAAALEASSGFSPAVAHACAESSDGGAAAWLFEGQRYAALCPNGRSLRRLVATLGNQAVALVLATKLPVLNRVRGRVVAMTD